MASYFGEVLQGESRAYWDDLEESDLEGFGVNVELLDEKTLELNYEVLIVTEGELVSKIARKHLVQSDSKKVALFYENLTEQCKRPPSTLYQLSNGALLLTTYEKLDLKLCNYLVEKLKPWLIKCAQVILFTSLHISKYRSKNFKNMMPPFIRSLCTNHYKGKQIVPTLESPNFISGCTASVLTLCQVEKKSAVLYICYSDCNSVNSVTEQPFIKTLRDDGFAKLLNPQNMDLKVKIDDDIHLSSNLYA